MGDIPVAGNPISMDDCEMILEAISRRSRNFPEEPPALTLALVLMNIGDRFAPVSCVAGEWGGLKSDVPPGEGIPKCPNGHVLTQGPGLVLAWAEAPQ